MLDLTLMTLLCWTASGGPDCMRRRVEQTTHEPYKVCYYTTWARYRPGNAAMHPHHVDPNLCTHIIIAFASVSPEGHLILGSEEEDASIVSALTKMKAKNSKLKVMIAVGGWNFGSEPFRRIIATEDSRTTFVNSTLTFLQQWNLDGLDLDWEYPDVHDRDNFTLLIKSLGKAFSEEPFEGKSDYKSKYLLTAAVPAVKEKMFGYDVPKIKKYLDFVNVMAYDFHGPWDNKTGHNSPLYSHDGFNIAQGSQVWTDAGMPRSKIIVGLATYGHSYKLQNKTNPAVGAPTSGAASGNYTRTPGFFAFFEVCELLHKDETVVLWDHFAAVPYCYNEELWISFDDVRSVDKKVEWILNQHYGGVMMWEMGMDDFSGSFCGGSEKLTYPLLKSINAAMSYSKPVSSIPRAKESSIAKERNQLMEFKNETVIEENKVFFKCNDSEIIFDNCTSGSVCLNGEVQLIICKNRTAFDVKSGHCIDSVQIPECFDVDENSLNSNGTDIHVTSIPNSNNTSESEVSSSSTIIITSEIVNNSTELIVEENA